MKGRLLSLFVFVWSCVAVTAGSAAQGSRQPDQSASAVAHLSPDDQNVLIRRHCLPCHSDGMPLGALSVEHLDVRGAPDSLRAMLLSQITQHLPLATAQAAHRDPAARAAIAARMRRGAMTAAGLPLPPDETIHALVDALAAGTADAHGWNVEPGAMAGGVVAGGAPSLTVSTVREVLKNGDGPVPIFRLIASCNEQTRAGELRVSWLPFPTSGTVTLTPDDGEPMTVRVDTPTTSVVLLRTPVEGARRSPIPQHRLVVSVPQGDTVEFAFDALPASARRVLTTCFS